MSNLDAPLEVTETQEEATAPEQVEQLTPEMVDVEMTKFFGFHPGDPIENADRDYMQTIWNYYAQGAKSQGEVIRRISEAERQIATPMPGETRLGKFYTFVRLLEDERSIKDEISAYRK